jgi:site-specific recombinase XerC
MLNLEWLNTEQEFLHKRVCADFAKLDREQMTEIFESMHKQYLIRNSLFSRLSSWCVRNGFVLPAFEELLSPKEVHHPTPLEE